MLTKQKTSTGTYSTSESSKMSKDVNPMENEGNNIFNDNASIIEDLRLSKSRFFSFDSSSGKIHTRRKRKKKVVGPNKSLGNWI